MSVCASVYQAFRRLWTCLCGNSLYFFNNAKDTHVSVAQVCVSPVARCHVLSPPSLCLQYIEKMDLAGFVSLKDDCSRDRNLEAARFILRMKDGETKLTVLSTDMRVCQKSDFSGHLTAFACFQAPNLESRELWKGFLYSVVDVNAHFLPTLFGCLTFT